MTKTRKYIKYFLKYFLAELLKTCLCISKGSIHVKENNWAIDVPINTPNTPKRNGRTRRYPARIINTIDYKGKTYEVIRKNDNVTTLRDPDTGSKIELTNDEVIEAMDRGEFGNETYTDQFNIYSNVPYTKQADPVWAGTN